MNFSDASVLPKRASTVEECRELVAEDGAAIIHGPETLEDVIEYGKAFLGPEGVRVSRQFTVSKEGRKYRANVPRGVPDERGRVVFGGELGGALWVHNDGKTFGDFSPEFLFLWMERPSAVGGESVLLDGLRLLNLLAEEPEYQELVEFCWSVPIDVSEAHFELPEPSCIARKTPRGGVQVRCHYNLRSVLGPDQDKDQAFIDEWVRVVREADEKAKTFRLEAGDLAVVDNYRLLHGRRAYTDLDRRLHSTWGWTERAFGVPTAQPDFDRPEDVVKVG